MRNILIEDKDKIEICEYEMMYNLELGFPLLKQADGFNEKIHYSKNSNIWFVRDKNVNTVHYSFGYFEENAVFDNLAPIFVIKLNSNYPLMSSLNAYFIINERTGRRSLTLNSKIYDDLGIDFTTMDVFNFREGLVELGSVDDANEIIKNLDVLMLRLKSQYEGDDVYTDDNSTSEVNDSQHLSNKDYSDFNQVLSYFKNEKYGECIALLDSISEDEFKMIRSAFLLAKEAHSGQRDKAGADYILHPYHVSQFVKGGPFEITAALLHDVVEDTAVTLDELRRKGFPDIVVNAVDAVTRRPGEARDTYLRRVKNNPAARLVKLADLKHNSDLTRIPNPQEKDIQRVKNYQNEIAYLSKDSDDMD